MKIVQINSSCGTGSTGKIVAAISQLLDENKVENYIFYSGFKINNIKNSTPINHRWQIRLHQFLSRLFGNQGWHSSYTTKKLIARIKKIQPDIIHLHNLHGYYLNMDLLFRYISEENINVVWTLHDAWAYTGHCTLYKIDKCYKWQKECANCIQKHKYPYSLFFDRANELFYRKKELYAMVKHITVTTVSQWLKNEVEHSVLLKNREIYVIPNGVDTTVFKPCEKIYSIFNICLKDKKILLGVANQWSERKGLYDFIKLAKKIKKEYIIILVGLSQDQISQLPSNVIGVQRTDNIETLASLYSLADIYINTSLEETFGLTNIEALACGTPIIVYNSTACAEIVTEDVGVVVQPGNVNALVQAIDVIINKGKASYTDNCRRYVLERYNEKEIYKQYINLYYEVIDKRNA